MHTLFKYLLLLLVSGLTACTNELSYEDYEPRPRLVMNAIVNADSTQQHLTLLLTGRSHPQRLGQGATLTITVNGQVRHTLRPDSLINNDLSRVKFYFDASYASGDVVRFDARTDDGQHHAWAEVVVPQMPDSVTEFQAQDMPSKNYKSVARYRFVVKDVSPAKDYYRLTASHLQQLFVRDDNDSLVYHRKQVSYEYNSREDMALSDGLPTPREEEDADMSFMGMDNRTGVFDDTYFTQGQYRMTIYPEYHKLYAFYDEDTARVVTKAFAEVSIDAISRDYYHFLHAYNVYLSDNHAEEVSEPIIFPSNVEGGTGFVTIFKRSTATFQIPFRP